jgi:hypothetical protein
MTPGYRPKRHPVSDGVRRTDTALAFRFDHEWPMHVDGAYAADSGATSLTTSLSTSWKVTPKWTLTGAIATDVLGRLGVARNRPERLTVTLGVRHAFF